MAFAPDSPAPAVTVFVPTKNAGPELDGVLERILAQDLAAPYEVLIFDSGSTDGTVERLRRQPVRRVEIPAVDFDHGATRQQAILEARGAIVALTVQDALPADESWLRHLVEPFADPRVAGVYGRQRPRPDASPLLRSRHAAWAASRAEPRIQELAPGEALADLPPGERLARCAFDNVNAAIRRSMAIEVPFRRCRFGEDLDWSLRAIEAGHRLVFEPRAEVVHSHDRSAWYELRRVYLDHQNLCRLFELRTVPDLSTWARSFAWELREAWRSVRAAPDLGPIERLRWRARVPGFAFASSAGQLLGGLSAVGHAGSRRWARWLDAVLASGV